MSSPISRVTDGLEIRQVREAGDRKNGHLQNKLHLLLVLRGLLRRQLVRMFLLLLPPSSDCPLDGAEEARRAGNDDNLRSFCDEFLVDVRLKKKYFYEAEEIKQRWIEARKYKEDILVEGIVSVVLERLGAVDLVRLGYDIVKAFRSAEETARVKECEEFFNQKLGNALMENANKMLMRTIRRLTTNWARQI